MSVVVIRRCNDVTLPLFITPASSVDYATETTGFAALGAAVKTEIDTNWK